MSNKIKDKDKEEEKEPISIKVTFVGNVGVGKTCLVTRLIKDEFDTSNRSTAGANYSKLDLIFNNKKITLDVWDTAGQEKFRTMGRQFYINSNIIIIVYDITKKESFEDIQNYWYNDVKENGEKFKVIGIVGNKFDLYDKEGVEEIDDKIVQKFVDKIKKDKDSKIVKMKVSAKNGTNIKNLLNELINQYFEKEFNTLIKNYSEERTKSDKLKNNTNNTNKKKTCC